MKSKTTQHCLLAALLVACTVGRIVTAAPVTVPNFSFETAALGDGTSTTNWNSRGNGGQSIQAVTNGWFTGPDVLPAPADGTNFLVINVNGNPGWCWQDIGPLQPNTKYTLTIAVGTSLLGDVG